MLGFDGAVFVPAFLVTLLEMTEVVALVFALSAGGPGLRATIYGALAGVAIVGGIGLAAGTALERLPPAWLLGPAAVVLAAFTVFLFRGTVRAVRRARAARGGGPPSPPPAPAVSFGAGLSVGLVETTEAVIVLLALAAPGYGETAIVGAFSAGALLIVLAVALHGQIRRIKVPTLRIAATSMVLTFAIFWGGEALRVPWPYGDLSLLPIFAVAAPIVVAAVWLVSTAPLPVETKS